MAVLCFQVLSPFLSLMIWALILAVTLYPLHKSLAVKIGGRQGLAATLLVLLGVIVAVVPTAALMNSLGDSVQRLIHDVQNNTLEVPPPREGVANGRWSASRCTRSGRRRTRICPHWCKECSRRSATWPRRRSLSSPASVASC
jgi:predicted PurR-regulated permease PerM